MDDEDEEPVDVACATSDCKISLSEPPDPYAEETGGVAVPPGYGFHCWVCRQNEAVGNRGLRGALRRMWHAPSHPQ